MSHQGNLIDQIAQQKKIIQYLQEQHLQNTGYQVSIPQSWQNFLRIPESKAPIIDSKTSKEVDMYTLEKKENTETFLQALSNLNLPQKLQEVSKKISTSSKVSIGKRSIQMTNFNPSNPAHMKEMINLSNFVNKKFTKAGFRELVESINDMRCLSSIILQDNGIDSSHQDELEALFLNKRLTNIDLSRNNIDKSSILKISRILKETVSHIEWLDLSRNDFSHDISALNSLILGLKNQKSLYHLAIDANVRYNPLTISIGSSEKDRKYAGSEIITRFAQRLRSLVLVDSKITPDSMKNIEIALQSPACHLISLNFQFCFLDARCVHFLSKGLEANRTLIKLDLSNNGLAPISGVYLVKALSNNISLHELNLSKNNLTDDFAIKLASTLRENDILWKVDISYNPIELEGAESLISALKEDNDSLESLGNIEVNTQMGVNNIQELKKHLKINEVSKDLKKKIIQDKTNKQGNEPKDLNSIIFKAGREKENIYIDDDNDDGIKLLKPLIFTNNPYKDGTKTNFYYSNGSGRDGYIVENSGGMTHTRRPQSAGYQSSRFMSFNMQKRAPYQASAKVIHYTSDGSGRDNYIINNAGGLMSKTHTNTNSSNIFRDFLRNYDKMENYGLYSVNIDEMQKLKKIQTLKSAKLSKSRQSNIPFHVLLERAKSININKS